MGTSEAIEDTDTAAVRREAWRKRMTGGLTDENEPCLKEDRMTRQCLNDTYQNPQKSCELYFANYRACSKFWSDVTKDRRRKGIRPALPPPKERAAIKEQYYGKQSAT